MTRIAVAIACLALLVTFTLAGAQVTQQPAGTAHNGNAFRFNKVAEGVYHAIGTGALTVVGNSSVIVNDDDVSRRRVRCEPRDEIIGGFPLEPVEVPQHPSPPDDAVAGACRSDQHWHASIAGVRPERATGLTPGHKLDLGRGFLQSSR